MSYQFIPASNDQEPQPHLPVPGSIAYNLNLSIPIVILTTGVSIMGITIAFKEPEKFLSFLRDVFLPDRPKPDGFFKRIVLPVGVGFFLGNITHDPLKEMFSQQQSSNDNNR